MGITLSFTYLVFFMILLDLPTFSYSCGANSHHRRRNRVKTPLQINERVPDMAEFSTGASGASTGRITGQRLRGKNSTLVPCYNTNVVFKDDEGTGADRLMSRRCREKLNELAKLVKSDPEWSKLKPPIKLRVIEAWDEDNEHSKNSLHYEGRAVDITTSDKDESKYGKLGRLAYEARFDWVYYANDAHIHASVREDGAGETGQYRGCFNADSSVKLQNGRNVAMRDLKIGDKVESVTEDGQLTYSEILLFIDNQPQTPDVLHCIIETEKTDKKIVLTPTHLIFTLKRNDTPSRLTVKHAESVKVGEFVVSSSGGNLVPRRVSKVYFERRTGTIAPLTRHGNIIVDGILASCYAVTGDHSLAHWSFIPIRLWHMYVPAIIAWDAMPQNGIHWYADFLISLNRIFGVTRLS